MLIRLAVRPPEHVLQRHGPVRRDARLIRIVLELAVARAALRARAPRRDRDDALVETGRVGVDAEDLVALLQSIGFVVRIYQTGLRPAEHVGRRHASSGVRQRDDAGRAELENFPVVVGVGDLVPVRKSTSDSSRRRVDGVQGSAPKFDLRTAMDKSSSER